MAMSLKDLEPAFVRWYGHMLTTSEPARDWLSSSEKPSLPAARLCKSIFEEGCTDLLRCLKCCGQK